MADAAVGDGDFDVFIAEGAGVEGERLEGGFGGFGGEGVDGHGRKEFKVDEKYSRRNATLNGRDVRIKSNR
jgi:hypothetical protein